MSIPFLKITDLEVKYQQTVVLSGLEWDIFEGENWLLGGKSGTGKTSLGKAIAGMSLPIKVAFVSNWFQFTNLEGDRNFYYQQRYNKQQANDTLTVYAELVDYGKEEELIFEDVERYLELFGFQNCRKTQLIELSSGENKKLQLIKALWLKPQLLILDQPYTGLDTATRQILNR